MKKKPPMDLEPFQIPSADSDDQPASRKLLKLVGAELRAEIRALDAKFEARFLAIDAKSESRFASIEATLKEMRVEIARQSVLLEEQNSNNRIVLEGLQALWQRQERIEKTFSAV